jgi:hypothetical protein
LDGQRPMVLRNIILRIRYLTNYLILFFIAACTGTPENKEPISIVWENDRATAITISRKYFDRVSDGELQKSLSVHLADSIDRPPILGEFFFTADEIRFDPLIPFTRKLRYKVLFNNNEVAEIQIPDADQASVPVLNGIFPSGDTLPRNLLKFYFQFSRPMREGQFLKHVVLLKNGKDTVPQVFLDLQPELWNHDRTLLTLWLDPGRIKRELQPNKKLGEPLMKESHYQLIIKNTFTDAQGVSLPEEYRKDFVVSERDSLSPSPQQWTIVSPRARTKEPLEINFHEILDHALLTETIKVLDAKANAVDVHIQLNSQESGCRLVPHKLWVAGNYVLQTESKLEDLAGNNLNRIFDREMTGTPVSTSPYFEIKFTID